tara:strand:+ start:1137 stop:1445 length:309 start_codon:yes stop_codon:yes gene_type:complete
MKKIIMSLVCVLAFAGCTLEYDYEPAPTDPWHTPSVYIEYEIPGSDTYYYDDGCWDEPYYYPPEWCDWYDDGTTCCVWWADGWYEEYCQWEDDYCWEYSGSF